MDWVQFGIFLLSVGTLFFWNRSESRNDVRQMDTKLDGYRSETMLLLKAIHDEMKDFHGRLCALEERSKK